MGVAAATRPQCGHPVLFPGIDRCQWCNPGGEDCTFCNVSKLRGGLCHRHQKKAGRWNKRGRPVPYRTAPSSGAKVTRAFTITVKAEEEGGGTDAAPLTVTATTALHHNPSSSHAAASSSSLTGGTDAPLRRLLRGGAFDAADRDEQIHSLLVEDLGLPSSLWFDVMEDPKRQRIAELALIVKRKGDVNGLRVAKERLIMSAAGAETASSGRETTHQQPPPPRSGKGGQKQGADDEGNWEAEPWIMWICPTKKCQERKSIGGIPCIYHTENRADDDRCRKCGHKPRSKNERRAAMARWLKLQSFRCPAAGCVKLLEWDEGMACVRCWEKYTMRQMGEAISLKNRRGAEIEDKKWWLCPQCNAENRLSAIKCAGTFGRTEEGEPRSCGLEVPLDDERRCMYIEDWKQKQGMLPPAADNHRHRISSCCVDEEAEGSEDGGSSETEEGSDSADAGRPEDGSGQEGQGSDSA